MIEKSTRQALLNLPPHVTVMGAPGSGKSSLLNALNVDYRPEPTEDIETLGMRLTIPEYSALVHQRMYEADSKPSSLWRDNDIFASVGVFQGTENLLDFIPKNINSVIVSESLILLNPPFETLIQNIIKRGRRSAMMEIDQSALRYANAISTFNLHPAKNKVILTLNSAGHYKISYKKVTK
jgi:deoxyadenosine/deoxycytidine kinase